MKTDLKNTTFIVPLRIDTGDRLRNVILSTAYLLHNFDTTVMIKEVDSERRFETFALPIIERLVDTDNLVHIFEDETRTDDAFHRTKVLNDMVIESTTDIVVNYDTDLILPVSSYTEAVKMLNGEYDVDSITLRRRSPVSIRKGIINVVFFKSVFINYSPTSRE